MRHAMRELSTALMPDIYGINSMILKYLSTRQLLTCQRCTKYNFNNHAPLNLDNETRFFPPPTMSVYEEAGGPSPLVPQFPGDDTRPTSKKELAGWYCYGWAGEVFTVCAMGMCCVSLMSWVNSV